MKYLSDSTFVKGSSHQVCEDYSRDFKFEKPIIVVSDGCSSVANSDVAARILALSAVDYFSLNWKSNDIEEALSNSLIKALAVQSQLNRNAKVLDLAATLLIAYPEKDNLYRVIIVGDGYAFYVNRNEHPQNSMKYMSMHSMYNMPYYLCYYMNPKEYVDALNCDDYICISVDEEIIKQVSPGEHIYETIFDNQTMINRENVLNKKIIYSTFVVDMVPGASLFLATDGIESFVKKGDSSNNKGVYELMGEIADVKLRNGAFMQRQINGIKRKFLKDDFDHYDDLGVAAIICVD